MRARLALFQAGIPCEIREIMLKNKPDDMVSISPKATVPVLQIRQPSQKNQEHPTTDIILDESIDIMLWALKQSDPDHWLIADQGDLKQILILIQYNDDDFKHHLDRYKYPNRYDPTTDALYHRDQACLFLNTLESRLNTSTYLFGEHANLADIAIFPFIRQFAAVDRDWFEQTAFPRLQKWLKYWLKSDIFSQIMHKTPAWQAGDPPIVWFTPQSPELSD